MKANKIGSLFLMSVLALAGIGVSYAGFSDSISIYGTVDTATVDIDFFGWYSGTWVYKIWGFDVIPALNTVPGYGKEGLEITYDPADEILIYHGWVAYAPLESVVIAWAEASPYYGNADLVSYAQAENYVGTDDYDIGMEYCELFPCIDFSADFIFHYGGSIPAKINVAQIFPLTEDNYPGDGGFLTWLWNYHIQDPDSGYGAWVEAYRAYPIFGTDGVTIIGWDIHYDEPVDVGYQLHACNYVYVKLVIHLPQDNNLQGLSGTFGGKIGVIQWNDACEPIPITPP